MLRYLDGRDDEAAGIAAQVEDRAAHTLRLESVERVVQLFGGRDAELLQPHVPGDRIHHTDHRHRRDHEEVPLDRDSQRVRLESRSPLQPQPDFAPLGPREAQLERAHRDPDDQGVVDGDEAVAGLNAAFGRRTLGRHGQHGDRAVDLFEVHPDHRELTPLQGADLFEFRARIERAVGVERPQHAVDRGPHQLGVGHGVDVVGADVVQHAGKRLQLFVRRALLRRDAQRRRQAGRGDDEAGAGRHGRWARRDRAKVGFSESMLSA